MKTMRVYFCNETLAVLKTILAEISQTYIQWAYSDYGEVPSFAMKADHAVVQSRVPFWKPIDDAVMNDHSMHPVRVFQHAVHVCYSSTRGVVDSYTQFRSELDCSGFCKGSESKVVL